MPDTTAAGKENTLGHAQVESIHSTVSTRYAVLLAIKLLKRFRKRHGSVLFLSKTLCVKYGRKVKLSEALAMQFVAKHTSIPVPRVYCAFARKHRVYIVMERIHGEDIGTAWFKRSDEDKIALLHKLKGLVEQMRQIRPPEDIGVANVNGGPLYDPRVPGPSNQFGPFATIQDFHKYLRGGLDAHPEHLPEISEFISLQDHFDSAPVFTHGDLSSLNILTSGNEIVGIVDWETAGWYPSYWEYTSAWNVNPQNQFWQDEVDKFLQPMPQELEMEKLRLKHFGDV